MGSASDTLSWSTSRVSLKSTPTGLIMKVGYMLPDQEQALPTKIEQNNPDSKISPLLLLMLRSMNAGSWLIMCILCALSVRLFFISPVVGVGKF